MNRSSRPNNNNRNRNSSSDNRGGSGGGRGGMRRNSRFQRVVRRKRCAKTIPFNYKDPTSLRQYISAHGRIKPMRLNGLCAKHQRLLAREIKRARHLAMLPFVTD